MSANATFLVIAHGLDDLAQQNPIKDGGVSPHRTYDAEGFRIRHMALDAGAVLEEHTAPRPIVVQVAMGAVRFDVDGEQHDLTQGAIIHVAANVPHAVTARVSSRLIITLIG